MSDGGLDLNAMSDEEVPKQEENEVKSEETSVEDKAKSEEPEKEKEKIEEEPVKEADIFEEEEEQEQAGLDLGEIVNDNSVKWIKIANLMRPFTPMGLRKKTY